jgi:hypothetical protein
MKIELLLDEDVHSGLAHAIQRNHVKIVAPCFSVPQEKR